MSSQCLQFGIAIAGSRFTTWVRAWPSYGDACYSTEPFVYLGQVFLQQDGCTQTIWVYLGIHIIHIYIYIYGWGYSFCRGRDSLTVSNATMYWDCKQNLETAKDLNDDF